MENAREQLKTSMLGALLSTPTRKHALINFENAKSFLSRSVDTGSKWELNMF